MKNIIKYIKVSLVTSVFLFVNIAVAEILISDEGDSLFYDKANNHYVIKYIGMDQLNEVIWKPPSDVSVNIAAKYQLLKDGSIKYKYKIEVKDDTNLPVEAFRFYTSLKNVLSSETPKNWKNRIRDSYDDTKPGIWINWHTSTSSVTAGNEIEGFKVSGMALPAYGVAFVEGETGILTYRDYGPNIEIQTYFEENIVSKHFYGKSVNTAVPLIPISVPFKPIETYASFHGYLLEYIEKQYIDQSIAKSMTDASLNILQALNNNSFNDAAPNLKALKKLIEGEDEQNKKGDDSVKGKPQPLIVKELRKILKFNIKYIIKKLKGDSVDD